MTLDTRDLIPVWHRYEAGCGGITFYLRTPLEPSALLTGADVVWTDGRPAVDGEPGICGGCGRGLGWAAKRDDGQYVAASPPVTYVELDGVRTFLHNRGAAERWATPGDQDAGARG